MKKDKKNNSVFVLLFMIVSALFIVPVILKWLFETPALFEFMGIVTKETYTAWIGYYGTVIGGGLTLVGVWWTIKFERYCLNQQNNINKMTTFFPTISARVIKNSAINDICSCINIKIENECFERDIEEYGDCLIGLENIGQAEIWIDEIILDSYTVSNVNEQRRIYECDLFDEFIEDGNCKFLPPRESFYLKIGFSKLKKSENVMKNYLADNMIFTIHYSFILNISGIMTEEDSYQYFLSFDADVHECESESYGYKIYNVSLSR